MRIMHLLPISLGKLADQTGKCDSALFALSGVHLLVNPDNTFTAEATDSTQLIRVSGPCKGNADEYPHHAVLDAAPSGGSECLIPGEVWRRAFATAAKTAKKGSRYRPILNAAVAVKVAKELTTFGATDLNSYPVEQTRNMEGQFPPTNDILKQCRKGTKFVFAAEPRILAGVLETLAAFTEQGIGRVEFHVGKPGKPLYITAKNPDGLTVESALMLLWGDSPSSDSPSSDSPDNPSSDNPSSDVLALIRQLNQVTAERDCLVSELAAVRGELLPRKSFNPKCGGSGYDLPAAPTAPQ